MTHPLSPRRLILIGALTVSLSSLCVAELPTDKLGDFTYAGDPKRPFAVQEYLRANVGQAEKYAALAESVRQQEKDLKTNDARELACEILAAVGDGRDVAFLGGQLKNEVVFPAAKLALQNIGTAEAVQVLLDFAAKASPEQTESLMLSFGILNVPATVPYTVSLTTSDNLQMRRAAFQALAANTAPEAAVALMQAPVKADDGSAAAMIEQARRVADKEQARQLCERVVKSSDLPAGVRAAAVRAMVARDVPGAGELLGQFEKSADAQTRPMLLENFRQLSPETQAKLVKEVQDNIGKPEAVTQLSAIGVAFPPAELLPLAVSPHTKLREVALRLLGQNGTEAEFQKALSAYATGQPDGPVTERWWGVLLALPAASEAWTMQALQKQTDTATELAAIKLVQARRIRVAGAELLASLQSEDPAVRLAAAEALATVGAPALAPRLGDLFLTSTDPKVRGKLALALTNSLRDSPSKTVVVENLSNQLGSVQDAAVREQLIAILANSGEATAETALWKLYDQADLAVKKSILRGMGQWKDATPLPRLAEIAGKADDESLKILATRSYLEVTAQEADPAKRLARLKAAQALANRPEEKRLIIAQAATLKLPEARALIESYRGDAALAAEVEAALADKTKGKKTEEKEFE